jgi:16S rRNA (uracil1498-N3)-methyltransferase
MQASAERLRYFFVDSPLAAGSKVTPGRELSRRLSRVLRLRVGARVALFNGRDGVFAAALADDEAQQLDLTDQLVSAPSPARYHLYIALTKRDAMDRVLRQATELGITDLHPVMTDHCVADKLNDERVQALIVEAAEQCERASLPVLHPVMPLTAAVSAAAGRVFWCAERGPGVWGAVKPAAGDGVLVGPEGGFSDPEKAFLAAHSKVTPVGLGAYVLRVDTAAAAGCAFLVAR